MAGIFEISVTNYSSFHATSGCFDPVACELLDSSGMRITTDMGVRMMMAALSQNRNSIHTVQRQLSSGRKVNLASDDPGAYEAIRNLSSDLSQLKQYERNADMARHYLTQVDQGIRHAVDVIHRANELTIRAGDATVDSGSRKAMAKEAEQLLDSLLAIANNSEGGRHTFAGLRTDTRPFEKQFDPDTGTITAVLYTGSEETRRIKTGQELYAATNIAGRSSTGEGGIFQTETRDVFDSIIRLRNTLAEGTDTDQTDLAERLQDDLAHLLNQASLNGARHDQVNAQRTVIREMQTAHLQSIDVLESVDVAEATMRLSQAETAYQSALYSTTNLLQQVSLLHFI